MPRAAVSDPSVSPPESSSRHDGSNHATLMASPIPSTSSDLPDSFLTRFILTPLRMISFLLSLALIDHRNRSYRVEQRNQPDPSLLGRMKRTLSSPWQGSEPYSDPNSAARIAGREHTRDDWEKRKEEERWTMKKRHRKIMKIEINDAVEIRKWVVVGLVLLSVLSGVGGVMAIKMLWQRWNRVSDIV